MNPARRSGSSKEKKAGRALAGGGLEELAERIAGERGGAVDLSEGAEAEIVAATPPSPEVPAAPSPLLLESKRDATLMAASPLPSARSPVEEPPLVSPPPALPAWPADEPLPARMLNEFVYCPRLFYYEFVEGVFVHNADTQRGVSLHQRVDAGSGALPAAVPVGARASRAGEGASPTQSAPAEEVKISGEASETARGVAGATLETIHSRSVSLGSARLGVSAKLDLVEVHPATAESAAEGELGLFARREVCPVDYKAGAPREGDEGKELWDADKMQLGLQVLLLRENGYVCDEGVIFYRATKQRVRLAMTPVLEAWILERIAAARACAAGPIPAPLVDSPKCPRCSLVTVCLPDETRLLANVEAGIRGGDAAGTSGGGDAAATGAPRRLIAARDESRALYLTTPGLFVGRSGEVIQVKEKKEVRQEVRIKDLSHVALFGNIQISTAVIQALCEADVPVTYFSMGGWFYGITRGHSLKNVFTRVEQFRLARDPAVCLWLARCMIRGKILNQRTMLMRNHLEPPAPTLAKLKNSASTALGAESLEELLGIEGAAAAFYFQQFNGMIKIADELSGSEAEAASAQLAFNFDFNGRKRRPPTDPVNALLSLAYSLLAKDCTIAALAVGFDPYVGFYHQPRFGRPALALDLMEEFRPLIAESCVLTAINTRMITEKDFVRAGKAVNLTAAGRRQFFQAYEARMSHLITHPVFEYKVTYRRAIELQFRILARYLTGEIEEYVPFMTR